MDVIYLSSPYVTILFVHRLRGRECLSSNSDARQETATLVYYVLSKIEAETKNMCSVAIVTDEELVTRCKAELPRNTRSYEQLVQRHMNRVYTIVYRVVNNKEETEDITQEVFVKVFNGLKKFDRNSTFSTWLYRIATNSALDAFDKIKKQSKNTSMVSTRSDEEEAVDVLTLQASPMPGPEENAVQAELRECIHRVLKNLDLDHRRVLLLRDFEDLSYDEIADVLQARLSAVKMRIHRARLAFQEIFNRFCGTSYLPVLPSSAQNTLGNDQTRKG